MRPNFTYIFSWILIIALAITVNFAFASGPRHLKNDTLHYSLTPKKPVKKKGFLASLSLSIPPIRAGATSTVKANVLPQSDKLLSNVEVYPNPVTDQINLKYSVSRNSTVTVKLMDVLGNNVTTLSSKMVEPGEQILPPYSTKNISRGFYFIHVVAGSEIVIKKVSIL
jgi:Secretion system C-terminal sorting domain